MIIIDYVSKVIFIVYVIIFWLKKMIFDKINRILVYVFVIKIDMGYWYNCFKYFDMYFILFYVVIYEYRRLNICI